MSEFKLTERQLQAQNILGGIATHLMLFGGSRSGKTFLLVRNVVLRALKAPNSRHLIARFRFNHIKTAIIQDTFPKVMRIAFEGVSFELNKTDFYAKFANGSEIWFAGLDDKERTEKILGNEYVTIYLNECSQIPQSSRDVVVTRLAQKVDQSFNGKELKPRMYYDCNPPNKNHWTYKLFVLKRDLETNQPLPFPDDYDNFQINPDDNKDNLSGNYLDVLKSLSARLQKRFLKGEFADATPNQLFKEEDIDKWRKTDGDLPQFIRVVVGVDPSGADDASEAENDAIGIVVGALGVDGCAYLLEDCTITASPKVWGDVATTAYDRHQADVVVGEVNYGGAMVGFVVKAAKPSVVFKTVTASRGKHVRAEPFSALYEQGKVKHVGDFNELEDELTAFSTIGYTGERSPNRADAWIWVLSELFPSMTQKKRAEVDLSSVMVSTKYGF